MSVERTQAKLRHLLLQLHHQRAIDRYAEEFRQKVARPERVPKKLPTLDPKVLQPISPMLAARFAFAGEWKHASLGLTWLSADGMKSAAASSKTRAQIHVRRQYWEGSVVAEFAPGQISLFALDRVESDEVYLVWQKPGKEPLVAAYLGQQERCFADLSKYVEHLLG